MWTAKILLGTRPKLAHANTAQMALSMCSSRYFSSFAPLFFLIFLGCRCFFWEISTFSFYFFDIFSSLRSAKEVTTENTSLNKWKVLPMENSENVLKIAKKAYDHEKRILCPVFGQNKKFWTRQSWISILSTCLCCKPIHVLSTRCIKWCKQQEYD